MRLYSMHSFNLQLYSASVLFHALIISLLLWSVLCLCACRLQYVYMCQFFCHYKEFIHKYEHMLSCVSFHWVNI